MMIKKYTVVGYYDDNYQPYVGWHEATSPEEAAKAAAKVTDDEGLYPLQVVEVFEGELVGKLDNETVWSLEISYGEL